VSTPITALMLSAVQVMREDEEHVLAEVAVAHEKQQLLHIEMQELQRHRDEVMAQLELIQEEHRQRLLPKISQLQDVRIRSASAPMHRLQDRLLSRGTRAGNQRHRG